jgi:hypothetical protein
MIGSITMQRTTSVLLLTLLVACTAPTPSTPAAEPLVTRLFSLLPCEMEDEDALENALATHGIHCSSFEGHRSFSTTSCQTICKGTESEWRRAKSDIARLTVRGVSDATPYPRYFEVDNTSEVAQALRVTAITCEFEARSGRSRIVCEGNERGWRLAEPVIARLTADGVMREESGEPGHSGE